MTTPAKTKNLDKLAALLRRKPLTARQIAKATGCCRPTAYARLAALEERGDPVFKTTGPGAATGPKPVTYGML